MSGYECGAPDTRKNSYWTYTYGRAWSHPKNRGSMTVALGGLGPPAYRVHPHKSVGLGFRKEPWKRKPFRRPYGIHWMRSLARYMNGCLSWRQPLRPPDGNGAVVADCAPPPRMGSTPAETEEAMSPDVRYHAP